VIVAGMHRSGTSLVAGLVQKLGVPPGAANDMPATVDNPGGYFESWSVVAFDNQLLAEIGGSWDAPPTRTPTDIRQYWESLPAARVESWRAILNSPSRDTSNWVIKDPRLSFLMAAWDRLAERPVPVIYCIRDPHEVADSLHTREGFGATRSLALWFSYNRILATSCADRPFIVIDYGQLMQEPIATSEKLLEFIANETGTRFEGDLEEVCQMVTPEYRRSQSKESASDIAAKATETWMELAKLHGAHPDPRIDFPEVPETALEVLEILGEMRLVRSERDQFAEECGEMAGRVDQLKDTRDALRQVTRSRGWRTLEKLRTPLGKRWDIEL
jgi:hypothetical protein